MDQAQPMFDLLEFPSQTIEDPSVLSFPFNKSRMLLEEVERRKKEREKENLAKEIKK